MSERSSNWWEGYRPPPAPVFSNASGVARFDEAHRRRLPRERRRLRTAPRRRRSPHRAPRPDDAGAAQDDAARERLGPGAIGRRPRCRGPRRHRARAVRGGGVDRRRRRLRDRRPGTWTLPPRRHARRLPAARHQGFVCALGRRIPRRRRAHGHPKAPELSIVLEREAFLPDANVRIGLRTFRIDDVDVTVSRVPNDLLLDAKRDFRNFAFTADTLGLVTVSRWKPRRRRGPRMVVARGRAARPRHAVAGRLRRARTIGRTRAARHLLRHRPRPARQALGEPVARLGRHLALEQARAGRARVHDREPASATGSRPGAATGQVQGWTGAIVEKRGMPPVRTDARGLVTIPTPGGVPAGYAGPRTVNPSLRVVAIGEGSGVAVVDPRWRPPSSRAAIARSSTPTARSTVRDTPCIGRRSPGNPRERRTRCRTRAARSSHSAGPTERRSRSRMPHCPRAVRPTAQSSCRRGSRSAIGR